MEAMIERCAGLDVHQKTVVACVLYGSLDKRPKKEIKTFPTNTSGLLNLSDWLTSMQVTDVVMESTGVYWKPIWNILEENFQLILANAKHVKNVPGRKTDVKDAEWLAKLLRSGLIESNFVPPEEIRDLRDLTRYRTKLVQTCTQEKNRIHKILQDANIKLTSVLSDIFGVSGRRFSSKTRAPSNKSKYIGYYRCHKWSLTSPSSLYVTSTLGAHGISRTKYQRIGRTD